MSSWSCPHEVEGLCRRVRGAFCRPGMRGCVLQGKVLFEDGVVPKPRWPGDDAPEPADTTPGAKPPRDR